MGKHGVIGEREHLLDFFIPDYTNRVVYELHALSTHHHHLLKLKGSAQLCRATATVAGNLGGVGHDDMTMQLPPVDLHK